jgi:two-component system nitrogen regulation response regulator GlnG
MAKVVVIDDDRGILLLVKQGLAARHEVETAETGKAGLDAIQRVHPDVVLLDILLRETTGLRVLEQILAIDRKLPVIFITADAECDTAIAAMQLGAFDYLSKPLDLRTLGDILDRAARTRQMMNVPVALGTDRSAKSQGESFIGRSSSMLQVFKSIGRVARQNVTVLIRGESGTGKELVARAIYQHSDRSDRPFMEVNCAALPENLLESELFGHEKGAFTGAERRRIGKFEQCHGGTIFLDEIGDMSPAVQSKVLRVLQEQRFERVGGNETIQTDVRVVAATNRPLEEMVISGAFREDLFYRLNGVTIAIPPLRDRRPDLTHLIRHFLTQATHELGKTEVEGLSPDALRQLVQYDWPGNVRELQAAVRQAVLNTTGTVIVEDFLPQEILRTPLEEGNGSERHATDGQLHHAVQSGPVPDANLENFVRTRLAAGVRGLYNETLTVMERYLFARVLQETGGNQSRAAEILGITRGKVRDRISTFGISVDRSVSVQDDGEPMLAYKARSKQQH